MISGKTPASLRPTALGTLLQAATQGLTIPSIHGTTQTSVSAIWAANLRQGSCRGKKKKLLKKKSPPTYVENVDFLIGSNPIEGVLQIWQNGKKLPLNFVKYDFSPVFSTQSVTIPDADFYFLLAVTAEIHNTGDFNDYGSPSYGTIATYASQDAGSGYAVNDTFTVNGGSILAFGHVTAVSGGHVTAVAIDGFGNGYSVASHIPTAATSGSGTGMTVQIFTVGMPYDDTSEYPLWNAAQHGPDLIDAGYSKFYPWIYKWAPSDGATFHFPFTQKFAGGGLGLPGAIGNFHAYYAQLNSTIGRQPPSVRACLTFEPVLGNGPEYTGDFDGTSTPLATQRILYPAYAGVGSPDIDLGSGAAIPSIQLETVGSHKRWHPRGDADFADMIEDTVKSGVLQTGSQLGLIQRGVNLNDLPGAVDKMQYTDLEPTGNTGVEFQGFQQPIKAGQILCCFVRWRYGGGGLDSGTTPPTISDDAGNAWTAVLDLNTGMYGGFWYAVAAADWPTGNQIYAQIGTGGTGFAYDIAAHAWVMDPGSDAVDGTPQTATGSGSPATCSIATSGPAFLIAVLDIEGTSTLASAAIPAHWNLLFPSMPNSTYVVAYRIVSVAGTYQFTTRSIGAASSWTIGLLALTASQPVPYPKALGNILDRATLAVVRAQCQATGLIGSVNMNSQKPASDWLKDFYQCANADPVWSGFKLKSIARSEVSAVGNGRLYTAPTAAGPVATLTEDDLIGDSTKPLIVVERKAQVDSYNIIQAQFFDRGADYNPSTASEPLNGAIALFGPRKQSPTDLPEIQDPAVARMILAIQANRYNLLRNRYKFTAMAKWLAMEAGDLILINDSKIGISNLPVRLTKVAENEDYELEMEAEPFVWGANSPTALPVTVAAPFVAGDGGDPGSVNTPIIFEAVPRLNGQQNQAEIWLVVSAASPNYGGCSVLISTDGGASYAAVGAIQDSAVTGVTVGDWPAANDPDTADDLQVDLSESLGELDTYAASDRDNFVYPCYVEGGTACIPYELMTYDIATLTAANKYTLPATGGGTNQLRRGVFGAPGPTVGVGVDHPSGSRFAFLNPLGFGILKLNMDPAWIGKTLSFKFPAVNQLGNNLQDQSAATAYSYTPSGCASGAQNPNNQGYSITGGDLTQPTPTTLAMAQASANFPSNTANYNARDASNTPTFTIPTPTAPTTYYVTIADPAQLGDTGSATNLIATAQTSDALVGAPGNIYIGSIVALPAGGGVQSGSGGVPVPASSPLVIGFVINDGDAGTNVGPEFPAPHPGTISKCKVLVKASDASVDLTFKINQNGVDVFSSDPTIAHGTAGGTLFTFTALTSSPLPVAADDKFTIDITSGSGAWKFTTQLE
jgi:hypothetical protein